MDPITAPAAGQPPAVTTPPADPPKPPAPAASAEPPAPPAPVAPREIGDDDEIKPGERVVMTHSALAKRVDRASRARLKEVLGTDDLAVIKANEEKRKQLEADAEKARLATLSEIERAKEVARIAEERASAAEQRAEEVEARQAYVETDAEALSVASEYIDPDTWGYVRTKLCDHLAKNFTQEQLDAMNEVTSEKVAREFLEGFVKEHPKFAKEAPAAGGGGAPAAPITRAPLTNGTANPAGGGDPNPAPLTGRWAGKTLKPGQPNSMTAQEVRAWKKEHGYTS